jgi:hypothetical protein
MGLLSGMAFLPVKPFKAVTHATAQRRNEIQKTDRKNQRATPVYGFTRFTLRRRVRCVKHISEFTPHTFRSPIAAAPPRYEASRLFLRKRPASMATSKHIRLESSIFRFDAIVISSNYPKTSACRSFNVTI